MTNLEKYKNAFKNALGLNDDAVLAELKYQQIQEWDSVGHMELISEIEDAFDIMMETEDIVDFDSFEKGIELLKKYNVTVE